MSVNEKRNLKDLIYESLKKEIIEANLKPNVQLLETELAKKFSVSRTPVREALNMLSMEGLVKPLPKNGYLVKDVSYKEMLESFYIRLLLEKGAAFLAASRISDKEVERLKELCIYTDFKSIWKFNKEFHMIIAKASGNKKLIRIIDRSIDDVKRVMALDPFMNLLESKGEEEHLKIIEGLEKRDEELASLAMEEHLLKARERIHEQLI